VVLRGRPHVGGASRQHSPPPHATVGAAFRRRRRLACDGVPRAHLATSLAREYRVTLPSRERTAISQAPAGRRMNPTELQRRWMRTTQLRRVYITRPLTAKLRFGLYDCGRCRRQPSDLRFLRLDLRWWCGEGVRHHRSCHTVAPARE
jgi:hypothetical protein